MTEISVVCSQTECDSLEHFNVSCISLGFVLFFSVCFWTIAFCVFVRCLGLDEMRRVSMQCRVLFCSKVVVVVIGF